MALLKDIADVQTGPFGSQLHKEDYVMEGTPIVTVEHLGNRVFTEQNLPMVSDEDRDRLSKYVLNEGDTVFSRVGSVDRCSYVDALHSGWMFSGRCLRVRPNELVNPEYLYYFFTTEETKQLIRNIAVGATMPSINTKILSEIDVPLPDLLIQTRIASVLSAIDEKIEINNRINRNLQELTFALFDHMVAEHSCGDVCNLSDFADINPKRNLSKNTEARCIDMAKLSTSGAFPDGWDYKTYTGGMKFKNGDTVLARITPCLENGKTAYINFLEVDEVAFGSTEYIVLAPKGAVPPELLYCFARYPRFVDYAVINMNGTSGRQRVSGEIIGQYQVPIFTKTELEEFAYSVSMPFEKMKQNSIENMKLAEVRNILLPKLMSGELDVSDIDI